MKNYLFKYIKDEYIYTLKEKPFNTIDAFVFSLIAYVPFDDSVLNDHYSTVEAIELIDSLNIKGYNKRKNKEIFLTKEVLLSNRFKDLELIHPNA